MSAFHVGDIWEPESTVKNKKGVLVKPSQVTYIFKSPAGKETTKTLAASELTEPSEGVFLGSIEVNEAGTWKVSVKTSGGYQASQPEEIQVDGVWG